MEDDFKVDYKGKYIANSCEECENLLKSRKRRLKLVTWNVQNLSIHSLIIKITGPEALGWHGQRPLWGSVPFILYTALIVTPTVRSSPEWGRAYLDIKQLVDSQVRVDFSSVC